ncbi:MAG: hypothetical protein ACOYNL_06185 [Rickettsiales bacterium]
MSRFARFSRSLVAAGTLAVCAIFPVAALAQADQPLVIIRFNQPRVYFDTQLYSAIEKAIAIKPEVTFEVVSYAPVTSDSDKNSKWQEVASHNTRAVVKAMTGMGVPMERIHVVGQSSDGIRYDETHVFVN